MTGARKLFWVFFLIFLSCWRENIPKPPGIPYVNVRTWKYILGPGDVIRIKLLPDNLNLSGVYKIDDEGYILAPVIGEFYVAGLTLVALKYKLKKELSKYIKDPKVQVFLEKAESKKIYVFGPGGGGIIFIQRPINILEALLTARLDFGSAQTSRIFVIKGSDKNPVIFNVNLNKIVKEGDMKENIMLEPGDIVYVPTKIVNRIGEAVGIYGAIGYSLFYGTTGLRILGIIK